MKKMRHPFFRHFFGMSLNLVFCGTSALAFGEVPRSAPRSKPVTGPEMEFEHSLLGGQKLLASGPGGAGWGTDDSLRTLIQVEEKSISKIYKTTAALAARPTRVKIPSMAQDRFENSEAKVFKTLRICVDQSLPKPQLDFHLALSRFLNSLLGPQDLPKAASFARVEWGDFANPQSLSSSQAIENCTVVFRRGEWEQPFRWKDT